jgi:hypothetical protein
MQSSSVDSPAQRVQMLNHLVDMDWSIASPHMQGNRREEIAVTSQVPGLFLCMETQPTQVTI